MIEHLLKVQLLKHYYSVTKGNPGALGGRRSDAEHLCKLRRQTQDSQEE